MAMSGQLKARQGIDGYRVGVHAGYFAGREGRTAALQLGAYARTKAGKIAGRERSPDREGHRASLLRRHGLGSVSVDDPGVEKSSDGFLTYRELT